MTFFNRRVEKPKSLQDVIKAQDLAAETFRLDEQRRQADQLRVAQGLLVELQAWLGPPIIVSIDSEIRSNPIGAVTFLMFSFPEYIKDDVAAQLMIPKMIGKNGQLRVEVYPENNSNHPRMMEEIALFVRGFRDIFAKRAK